MDRRERIVEARQRARGRRELAPEVDLALFTEQERAALFRAEEKIDSQRRPAGLKDATVLTEEERVAVAKYLILGEYGAWRPEFAHMTPAPVAAAIEEQQE